MSSSVSCCLLIVLRNIQQIVDTILLTVIFFQSTSLPSTVADTEEKVKPTLLASSLEPHLHSETQHVQLPKDHQDGG